MPLAIVLSDASHFPLHWDPWGTRQLVQDGCHPMKDAACGLSPFLLPVCRQPPARFGTPAHSRALRSQQQQELGDWMRTNPKARGPFYQRVQRVDP